MFYETREPPELSNSETNFFKYSKFSKKFWLYFCRIVIDEKHWKMQSAAGPNCPAWKKIPHVYQPIINGFYLQANISAGPPGLAGSYASTRGVWARGTPTMCPCLCIWPPTSATLMRPGSAPSSGWPSSTPWNWNGSQRVCQFAGCRHFLSSFLVPRRAIRSASFDSFARIFVLFCVWNNTTKQTITDDQWDLFWSHWKYSLNEWMI